MMNWKDRQFRFSIRKLKVAVASTVVGITSAGLLGHVSLPANEGLTNPLQPVSVQADEQGQRQQVSISYHYVSYEELTPEQKSLLRDSKHFTQETAQKDTHYLLVYRKDKGLIALPETGDATGFYSLLSGLGILGLLLAVTKGKKGLKVKVLVVTGLTGVALTATNSQALETGLRTFLTETHLVKLGELLPQPQAKIGDQVFTYYIPQVDDTAKGGQDVGQKPVPGNDKARPETIESNKAENGQPTVKPQDSIDSDKNEQGTTPLDIEQPDEATAPDKQVSEDKPETEKPEISKPTEETEQPGENTLTDGVDTVEEKPETEETEISKPTEETEQAGESTLTDGMDTVEEKPETEKPEISKPTEGAEQPGENTLTDGMDTVEEKPETEKTEISKPTEETEQPGESTLTNGMDTVEEKPETEKPEISKPTEGAEQPGENTLTDGMDTVEEKPETEKPEIAVIPDTTTPSQVERIFTDTGSGISVQVADDETQAIDHLVIVSHLETDDVQTPEVLAGTDYDLFDIELVDQNNQPVDITRPARVTLPVDEGKTVEQVFYLPEGDKPQELAFTESLENGRAVIHFTAEHFSYYGIIYRPVQQHQNGEGLTSEDKPTLPLNQIVTEDIPFGITTIEDPNLWAGETSLVSLGQKGSLSYIILDGVRHVLAQTPSTNQIERIGTKPVEGTISVTEEVTIPTTEVDYVNNDQLPEGEVEFISPAIYGKKTVTTIYRTIKGERTDEVIGQPVEVITQKPVKAKLGLGTKKDAPQPVAVDKTELAKALTEAAFKKAEDYTPDSWQVFADQKAAAQQTLTNNQTTQEEVNTATANLRKAITGLTPKPAEKPEKPATVDKTELEKALTEAATKKAADYTTDSWKNFERQAIAGQQTFNNPQATQEQVNTATTNLRKAITGLTPKPAEKPEKPATVDKTELEKALIEAATKKATDYTTDSWKNFERQAITGQQTFNNPQATQEQVNTATANLRNAITGLTPKVAEKPEKPTTVDKTELEKALTEAATKKAADYTTDSWKNFERQAIAGQQTFNNPQATQEQVNTATANLRKAITGLTPKPAEKPEKPATVDKTELEKALAEAATKKAADYTTDSWKNFERQAIAGQQTFNNPQVTQEQVNTATANLRTAITGLTPKPAEKPEKPTTVDKTELEKALAEAATKKAADYTTDSWKNFERQAIAGQQTFNNPQVTQEQVNAATTNLREAIKGLLLKQADRPILDIISLTTDDQTKTATISYQLTDPKQTFTGATVSIYQGNQKISEMRLTKDDLANKQLTFANYDTDYQIRTAFTYTKDGAQETVQLPNRDVRFSTKKLEIKDIDHITLHRYVNGNLTTVDNFQGKSPEAASQYFIRINSSRYRDLLLPVGGFEATTHNGQAAFRVKTNVDQLVEGSAQAGFQDQFDFLVGKDRPLSLSDQHRTNYTSLPGAQTSRATAYQNMEKLLPFYNKETLVSYGNLIDPSSKLHNTKLLSVTPMVNNQIIADVSRFKTELNRLMLHYADETIDYLPLAYKSDFRNTAVSEYSIGNTGLIYTPEQFLSNHDRIVEAVLPSLRDVAYKSEAMQSALNIDLKGGTVSDAMDKLYLEPTFNAIKADLPNQLRQLLATDKAIMANNGVVQDYVIDYIKANKERILMGLAYLNRWYNVNFDQTNIKNLASFHQDFFGKPVNTLEFLVNLTEGKEGYDYLKPSRNLETYKEKIAPVTGKAELTDYLTANRKLFTRFEDDHSWFKATTKAYIVEEKSKELPDQDVRVYSHLKTAKEANGILPLLTAKEDELFIMTTMGSITYGMYDRYLNADQPKSQQLDKIKERVNLTAKRQAAHFDAWYRIAPKQSRDKLIKPMPVWDGYYVNNGKDWLPLFGDRANQAIKDFFGPVGDRADVTNIGAGAWADGERIAYNHDKVLEDYGTSVFTHEATHNNDGKAYLGGYDRREGMGAEAYALGLLQSGSLLGHAEDALTLNLIFDYKDKEDALDRMTNVSPERFQNADDVKTYMNGVFDVLYTLDYAEAEAVLKQGTGLTKNWFGVLENYDGKDEDGRILPHAGNSIRGLTDQEAASLTKWQDLIDRNLIGRRGYATTAKGKPHEKNLLERNGYFQSYLFTPHYAALSNDKGAPGDLMFRRMAFELLAEKGYKDGFLPYTSGFLGETAKKEGSLIYSNWFGRDVPLITDKHVFDYVLKDSYTSWADFKKAMFQRRIDKTGQLAPITITYLGETVELTSFEQIQILMDLAVQHDATAKVHNTPVYSYVFDSYESYDIAHGSHVNSLKAAIYNAYLRQTKDFRDSIYHPVNSPDKPKQPEEILAPPASLNLISNPSLETRDYTSNKPNTILHRTSNRADYTKVVDGNKVYKSKDKTANDFFFYEVATVPGKTYTVTADIRLDVTPGHQADGAFFAVKVVEPGGNQRTLNGGKGVNQMADSVGKWAKQTLTFTADSTKTHIGLVKWHDNQSHANTLNTTILMDNLKVAEDTVYHERWKETFNGDKLNDQVWSYELGNVRGNEQQHYSSSKENVNVADGVLKITATNRPQADQYRHTQRNGDNARLVTYNSGSVQTIGRQEFLYGRIEARMKLPKGQAVFPAFWTLGADFNIANRITHGQGYGWPATGEIDVMEMVGSASGSGNQTVYGTPHFYYPTTNNDGNIDSGYHGTLTLNKDFADDYHVFGINWSEDRIEWYVDDVIYNTLVYDNSERSQALKAAFNRPQYIQFNLATGGNWPGDAGTNLAGQSLDIDWVRWLQNDKQKADMERYYADKPKLSGVDHVTIVKGEVPNLINQVTIDRKDYRLEVSIDDEFMFVNAGAAGGRNEPKNVVKDASKLADIANLEAGVYNIFYTTIPTASDYSPRSIPVYKMTRGWSHLVVLPTYYGAKAGALLSSITLPDGWRWVDPNQTITADGRYDITITNTKDPISPDLRREYTVSVSGHALMKTGRN